MKHNSQSDNDLPKEDEILRAIELLNKKFGRSDDIENLVNQLQNTEATSNYTRNLWKIEFQNEYKFGRIGLSDTAIKNKISGLESIEKNKNFASLKTNSESNYQSFKKFLDYCDIIYTYSQKYIEEAKLRNENNKKRVGRYQEVELEKDSEWSLSGTKWYVYFLYYINENGTMGLVNEASIGRAVLIFPNNATPRNLVELKNISLDIAQKYSGNYQDYTAQHRGYIIIDLTPVEKQERGRHIHMKLYYRSMQQQDIMIGQNVSYERGNIQSGNIVLKRISERDSDDNLEPKTYSFIHNWEEYTDKNVPLVFRQFLSDGRINFSVLDISSKINTEKALGIYMASFRDTQNKRFERFLERPKPRLFFSTPNSVEGKEIVESVGKVVHEEFGDNLHISYKVGTIKKTVDLRGSIQPYMDIQKLKTTRFFILILPNEVNELSYSFLQLGIALTVCKVVVLIGKEKYISKSLREMRSDIIKKIYVPDKSDKIDSEIIEKLIELIKKNLPKHLGGIVPDLTESS